MGKIIGILMGLHYKQSWNTPLAAMRDHYTIKGNLGNGHECPS